MKIEVKSKSNWALSFLCSWIVVIQLLSHFWLFVTAPWTEACQASLSFPISWRLHKFISSELVMPFNHLILCPPDLLLPSVFPSIRVFSSESALRIRWPRYWSLASACFSFSISPSNECWFPLGLTILISLQSKGLPRVFSSTAIQKHQFFDAHLSLWSDSHIRIWLLEKP